MSVRDEALNLIEELRSAGRITTVEARALREGVELPHNRAIHIGPKPNENAPWGERLAFARKAKGLTQRDVADVIGISVQAVSQWENGASEPSRQNHAVLERIYAPYQIAP